jgi:hypothetical protein
MYDDIRDLRLSLNGDLSIEDGDLSITSGVDWYKREANKRLRSGQDWAHHPNLGANLHRFVGQTNDRETGRRIREAATRSLIVNNIHFPAELQVDAVPTGLHEITLVITLVADGEREVVSSMILHFDGGTVVPIPDPLPTEQVATAAPYTRTENKYQQRLRR